MSFGEPRSKTKKERQKGEIKLYSGIGVMFGVIYGLAIRKKARKPLTLREDWIPSWPKSQTHWERYPRTTICIKANGNGEIQPQSGTIPNIEFRDAAIHHVNLPLLLYKIHCTSSGRMLSLMILIATYIYTSGFRETSRISLGDDTFLSFLHVPLQRFVLG